MLAITKSVLHSMQGRAYFRLRESRELVIAAGQKGKDRHIFPFNVTESTMLKHIPEHQKIESQELVFLIYMLYLYTLRLMFNRRIKKFSKIDKKIVDEAKDNVFASFDLVKYKIATMKCITRKLHPERHLNKIGEVFEDCGLSREDRVLYCLAYYNGDLDPFKQKMREMEGLFVMSCEALKRETDDPVFLREISKTASYFAYQKISFIAHGNRLGIDSLMNDLRMRAVQAYYWVRPFHSKLHAINYAKSAIQGWAWCLKDYYNDPARERTRPDGFGGHENTIVQLTEENDTSTDGYTEDHLIFLIDRKRELERLRKEGIDISPEAFE